MKEHKRHLRFWRFACFLLGKWSRRKFNITAEEIALPEGANLILANHVSNYDPFFVAAGIGYRHSYFVCADNIMRKAWIRNFFAFFMAPIVQIKGKSGLKTVQEMLRRFKSGYNVAIFPEGNRCFDGRTTKQPLAIGKLAKKSGANLVLLTFEGGYFAEPRWGTTLRKGRVHVKNRIVTAEQLKEMTAEEVTDLINTTLYTDAYEEQALTPTVFRGKHLALGMEAALYRCPKCGRISTLKSDDTQVYCMAEETCDFRMELDAYGYLTEVEENPGALEESKHRHTISEYMDEQRAWLEETVAKASALESNLPLFQDTLSLRTVDAAYHIEELGEIQLTAYADRIEYRYKNGQGTVTASDLEALAIFSRNLLTVFFPKDERAYEMRGDLSFSALKYRDLYEIVNTKQ